MVTVVEIFRNLADGVSAYVTKTRSGYSVTLHDDDAGMTVPIVRIFPELEPAVRYAKTLV